MEKKQLEAKIIKIAAELFPFVHTNKTSCVEFLTLRTKLADAVWRWALVTFNPQKMENAAEEIMNCINRSIVSYEGTAEQYIRYLAHSLKQEINRANARLNAFTSAVIPLPEKKRRKWKQLCSYTSHYGKDIELTETQVWLAKRTGYAVSEIVQLMEWDRRSKVKSAYTMAEGGEEISIFETTVIAVNNSETTVEGLLIEQEHIEQYLQHIDAAFASSQDRTKPYLSALLTHRVLCELDAAKIDGVAIAVLLRNKTFAATEHGRKLIRLFFEAEPFPVQEDIAAQFGKDKTDASRALSTFIKKLQKNCQPTE